MLGVSAKKVIFENFVSYEDFHGQRRNINIKGLLINT